MSTENTDTNINSSSDTYQEPDLLYRPSLLDEVEELRTSESSDAIIPNKSANRPAPRDPFAKSKSGYSPYPVIRDEDHKDTIMLIDGTGNHRVKRKISMKFKPEDITVEAIASIITQWEVSNLNPSRITMNINHVRERKEREPLIIADIYAVLYNALKSNEIRDSKVRPLAANASRTGAAREMSIMEFVRFHNAWTRGATRDEALYYAGYRSNNVLCNTPFVDRVWREMNARWSMVRTKTGRAMTTRESIASKVMKLSGIKYINGAACLVMPLSKLDMSDIMSMVKLEYFLTEITIKKAGMLGLLSLIERAKFLMEENSRDTIARAFVEQIKTTRGRYAEATEEEINRLPRDEFAGLFTLEFAATKGEMQEYNETLEGAELLGKVVATPRAVEPIQRKPEEELFIDPGTLKRQQPRLSDEELLATHMMESATESADVSNTKSPDPRETLPEESDITFNSTSESQTESQVESQTERQTENKNHSDGHLDTEDQLI